MSGGGGSSTRWGWGTATAVEMELQVLECTICYYPLKPPVFQCSVGHVVCSTCLAKLRAASRRTTSCHMCGSAGGFTRCFAVEHILDSVQIPCANAGAIRGCKTAYHSKEEHEETCPHGGGTEIEAEAEAAGPGVLPEAEAEAQERDGKNQGDRKGGGLIGGFGGLVLCISVVIVPVLHGIIMRKNKKEK